MIMKHASSIIFLLTIKSLTNALSKSLPDDFGPKLSFQTIKHKNENGDDITTERLIRCGIEKNKDGSEIYPCNPSFDTRPFIHGLDHIGTGFDALTGERRAPLFEWSVPAWYKPSYDSSKYNYEFKIPEQILLTAIPSGEGGMVTELFSSYDEFESKSAFALDTSFGALGAAVGFSLSKSSQRFRSAFDEFEIGVSKQKYKVYELKMKKDMFGTCPYTTPIFSSEKGTNGNTVDGREAPSPGVVEKWSSEETATWAEKSKLPSSFVQNIRDLNIPGALLVTLNDEELNELKLDTSFLRHKFRFDIAAASKIANSANEGEHVEVDEGEVLEDASLSVGDATTPKDLKGLDFAHPRYLRKYVMRQAFIDAVNNLPVFNSQQINQICPFLNKGVSDEDEEIDENALQPGTTKMQTLTPASKEAVQRYRRFLHDWGTHFATSVTFGGEVEVTTMIRKSKSESKSEDETNTETKIENDVKEVREREECVCVCLARSLLSAYYICNEHYMNSLITIFIITIKKH